MVCVHINKINTFLYCCVRFWFSVADYFVFVAAQTNIKLIVRSPNLLSAICISDRSQMITDEPSELEKTAFKRGTDSVTRLAKFNPFFEIFGQHFARSERWRADYFKNLSDVTKIVFFYIRHTIAVWPKNDNIMYFWPTLLNLFRSLIVTTLFWATMFSVNLGNILNISFLVYICTIWPTFLSFGRHLSVAIRTRCR